MHGNNRQCFARDRTVCCSAKLQFVCASLQVCSFKSVMQLDTRRPLGCALIAVLRLRVNAHHPDCPET